MVAELCQKILTVTHSVRLKNIEHASQLKIDSRIHARRLSKSVHLGFYHFSAFSAPNLKSLTLVNGYRPVEVKTVYLSLAYLLTKKRKTCKILNLKC